MKSMILVAALAALFSLQAHSATVQLDVGNLGVVNFGGNLALVEDAALHPDIPRPIVRFCLADEETLFGSNFTVLSGADGYALWVRNPLYYSATGLIFQEGAWAAWEEVVDDGIARFPTDLRGGLLTGTEVGFTIAAEYAITRSNEHPDSDDPLATGAWSYALGSTDCAGEGAIFYLSRAAASIDALAVTGEIEDAAGGVANSLRSRAENAIDQVARGMDAVACVQVSRLYQQVVRVYGSRLEEYRADDLLAALELAAAALSCGD